MKKLDRPECDGCDLKDTVCKPCDADCTCTLDTFTTGQKGVVKGVCPKNIILCRKLLAMGIVSGTPIEVLRIAPLGDPIKIRARGYKLSLRMSEAQSIEVIPGP